MFGDGVGLVNSVSTYQATVVLGVVSGVCRFAIFVSTKTFCLHCRYDHCGSFVIPSTYKERLTTNEIVCWVGSCRSRTVVNLESENGVLEIWGQRRSLAELFQNDQSRPLT